jgi:hypothetical protein
MERVGNDNRAQRIIGCRGTMPWPSVCRASSVWPGWMPSVCTRV